MSGTLRDVALVVLRRAAVVGSLAFVPTALAVSLAVPPPGAGPSASGPLLTWLLLPAATVAVTALLAALDRWPLFGRDLDGARFVRRSHWTLLDGCGLASLGALVALVPLLAATGLGFAGLTAWLAPDAPTPRSWSALQSAAGGQILDRTHASLTLTHAGDAVCDALRLNPIAVSRDGVWSPTGLVIALDGVPLPNEVTVAGNRDRLDLPVVPPRRVREVVLTRQGESAIALVFPPRAAELRHAVAASHAVNLVFAALAFTIPAALALAVACLGRRVLAARVQGGVALGVFVLLLLMETGPHGIALRACAAGRAVASEPWASTLVLPAALATILFAVAMLPFLLDRRRRASTVH